MNYTLKQLQERVNNLIESQGEGAYCAAWIYTKEDFILKDENGEIDYDYQKTQEFLNVSSMILATLITSIR